MNYRIRPLYLPLLFLIVIRVSAQTDTSYLSLFESIRIAQESGPLGLIARRAYDAKKFSYDSFASTFYPQLNLRGDVPGYYRSINSIVLPDGTTIFTPQSQASSSLNLVLSQKIPFTGADLSFTSGLNRIDLLETHSQYYRSNPLTVSLRQPLFQINTMKWDREIEYTRIQMAEREQVEAMEEIAIEVTGRFFDYYLASMNSIAAAINLANNDTLYNISKGRFNVGKIAENDLLQSELAFLNSRTQLENARLASDNSESTLRSILDLPVSTAIVLTPPVDIPDMKVDSATAIKEARRNRSDMLNFEIQRLTAERNVDQARSDNLFNATMSASVGFNQRSPLLREAYRNLLDQQQFTISLDIPLFRWGASSAAIAAATASREEIQMSVEQQMQNFERDVYYQVSRLNLLRQQVIIAAKADTIARRRFDVAKDRYLIGKIDIPNLFLAQDEKDNTRRSRIQTLRDFWTTYYRVRRLTLYDHEAGRRLLTSE